MYRLLFILLLSFTFTQDVCKGTCLSEEESINLANNIKELEFKLEKSKEIEENLNSQIYMYIQSDSLYQSQIMDYKKQIELKDDMIKLVKPKWYENKWIWFGLGVMFTSGSVHLAGQIN
tara:strand:+ start:82 stop:438 length:357 start_codon:yes stop_codon:yes gene_type:complete